MVKKSLLNPNYKYTEILMKIKWLYRLYRKRRIDTADTANMGIKSVKLSEDFINLGFVERVFLAYLSDGWVKSAGVYVFLGSWCTYS